MDDGIFVQDTQGSDELVAHYRVTSVLNPHDACMALCKEQSLGPFRGAEPDLVRRYSAKYVPDSVQVLETGRFEVDVVFPLDNCENSLGMVLSAVAGDLFNFKTVHPLKLLSLRFPVELLRRFDGPAFGVEGLREMLEVRNRPLLVGPVKPCVGLKPEAFAERAFQALVGGADIVKDDELLCEYPFSFVGGFPPLPA